MYERQRRARPTPTTGDSTLDLIAATFKLALKDAGQGDPEAIAFLELTMPDLDWRKMAKAPPKRRSACQESRREDFLPKGYQTMP